MAKLYISHENNGTLLALNSWRQDRALNNLWRRYRWSQRIMEQMKHTISCVILGQTFRFGQVIEKPRMSQNCGRHTVRKSVSIQAIPIKRTFERRPKSYGFFKNLLLKVYILYFAYRFGQSKDHCNYIQKIIVFTIPLAICNANENSCWVEKLFSSSQRTSSDSFRFSIESDIAELKAWLAVPGDADGLDRNSLSVTLNFSS